MTTDNASITPLTLRRARAIVGYAEDEFASGRRIEDAFTPFSRGGAAIRLDAVHVLYIVIADYFHSACVRDSGSPDAMKRFGKCANLSGGISWRILRDNIRDPAKVPDALGGQRNGPVLCRLSQDIEPGNRRLLAPSLQPYRTRLSD
jgi:hypothetical protein